LSHEYMMTIAIPVVNGLVEAAKKAGLPNKFAPLLAILFGLLAALALRNLEQPVTMIIIEGLLIGLSAVGLYSGTRNVLRNRNFQDS